jgi:hypothetical protein
MAGRIISPNNMNVPGLIPVLHKFLTLPGFKDGKVSSFVLGRRYVVRKFKVGLNVDVKAPIANGYKVHVRKEKSFQEVRDEKLQRLSVHLLASSLAALTVGPGCGGDQLAKGRAAKGPRQGAGPLLA